MADNLNDRMNTNAYEKVKLYDMLGGPIHQELIDEMYNEGAIMSKSDNLRFKLETAKANYEWWKYLTEEEKKEKDNVIDAFTSIIAPIANELVGHMKIVDHDSITGTSIEKGFKACVKGCNEAIEALEKRKAILEKKKRRANQHRLAVKESNCYYRHPEYEKAINEFFDFTDRNTRKILLNVNEADQSQILTSLTSRLYDNIVDKVDDIDFGEIPMTKGDITKLSNYDKLVDSIEILQEILQQYKQDPKPILVLSNALENIKLRRELFERAFKMGIELPVVMYNTICLSIISGVSYMIATCIEFIKTPSQENFDIVLDRVAYAKTKQNLIYTNLDKFNDSCKNGDFDRSMEYLINSKVKNFTGAAASFGVISGIAMMGLILNIIPILRELVFFFYYSRTRISDYFDAQADLLQMNAYNYEHNESDKDPEEKKHIINKQLKIVSLFRKISDKISIDNRQSEIKATKEIVSTNKRIKAEDIMDSIPDSASSALF